MTALAPDPPARELGDLLRQLGRHAEAEPHYRAILADVASSSYHRKVAQEGLARCALASGDLEAARRAATAPVRLAEPLGDDNLCPALGVLVDVARAAGDLPAAEQAAARHLEAAQRIGGHHRSYYAVRDVLDVALDRGDRDIAQRLLEELDEHAAALDATVGDTTFRNEVERRRARLTELEAEVWPPLRSPMAARPGCSG